MPDLAWSNWGELRAFSDCTTDALGDPHLGEANVTLPDWKAKDLRWVGQQVSQCSIVSLSFTRRAYYASVSHADDEIGRYAGK